MKSLSRSARARTAGYTIIEVLMAMTVMAIGGAAVISMQKTSMTANLDARKADVANAIARTWVERLQRDAMQWTLPGPENPSGDNLANAVVLSQIKNTQAKWFLPIQGMGATIETMSPAFDILGRDLPTAQIGIADFCVNVRLTWLSPATATKDLIRADVRVLWPVGIVNSLPGFCNAATAVLTDPNLDTGVQRLTGADPNQPVFHAIYVTTIVKENTSP